MSRRALIVLGCLLLVAAAGGALALVLSGGDSPSAAVAATTTTAEPTTTTAAPGPAAPLTGLPVDDPALVDRVALVVKIDNVDSLSRPQVGINQADVVYEEKIEGTVTRFAAIYQSQGANPIGPVRSGRSTDIAIVTPLHLPLYAFSGANAVTVKELRAAPLIDLGYDVQPAAYYRQEGRKAPDNLFSNTDELWALAPPDSQPPPALFAYRSATADPPASAVRVGSLDYAFGSGPGGAPVKWVWDPTESMWLRWQNGTPHVDGDDIQIARTNVVVQFVDYIDTGLVDTAGSPVPEAQLVGEGDVWVLRDGHLIAGRWSRPTVDDLTTWTDPDGQPMAFTVGQTWVALVPNGGLAGTQDCAAVPDDPGCA
jgi:hypothetical protein